MADHETQDHSQIGHEVHAHLHVHSDGTVHNHYHSHAGGDQEHSHADSDACEHAHAGSSGVYPSAVSDESHDTNTACPPLHAHDVPEAGFVTLKASQLSYAYENGLDSVFDGISLQAEAGKVLAILGNNGAGKSTLLNLLAGIEQPDKGSVQVGGRNLSDLTRKEVARHVAYVAQQQKTPHLSVYDQVLLGRKPHIAWSLRDYDRMVVARTLNQLDLEPFSARYLDELSGGERQKVYIARALAQEPEVLLLDEPTSALDPKNQTEVLSLIRKVTQEESIATVMVIHDINLALRYCDRFVLMRDGRVIARGDRSVVTEEALLNTYDMPFKMGDIDGVPVAIPFA